MKWTTSHQTHRYNVRDILKYSQVSITSSIVFRCYLISYFVYVLLHNMVLLNIVDLERSLMITKWWSEAVTRNRIDHTIAKKKTITNNHVKNTVQKTKDRTTRTQQKTGINPCVVTEYIVILLRIYIHNG